MPNDDDQLLAAMAHLEAEMQRSAKKHGVELPPLPEGLQKELDSYKTREDEDASA